MTRRLEAAGFRVESRARATIRAGPGIPGPRCGSSWPGRFDRLKGRFFRSFRLEHRHVRPFQVAHDQAQEGRARRQARQAVHAPHQGNDRRGPQRRRRHQHEPAVAHRGHRGQGRQHAGREHQAGDSARHRRAARRHLRRDQLRGLRPRRRGRHHRDDDRQQEPHRRRDPPHAREVQRQPRRGELGRLDVLEEGLHGHREGRRRRGEAAERRARGRRRRPARRRRQLGSDHRAARSSKP